VFFLLIVVPLAVAAATSVLLARREAAAGAGTATKHTPRAAGFGRGGQPVPVEYSGEPGLPALLEPDYYRPVWLRLLRALVLAVLLTATAAGIAAGIFFLLRAVGLALKSFVTGGG
jgi:hypothetical protein